MRADHRPASAGTWTPSRRALLGAAAALPLGGCAIVPTFHAEVQPELSLAADQVLMLGRIDLIPPLAPQEQKIRVGSIDPMDTPGKLRNRAVFFLSDQPAAERTQTTSVMNPVLGQWFAFAIPRAQRYVTDAAVFMEYAPRLYGRRQAVIDSAQLLLPALFAFDVRPADRALFIGQWRVWRDDFHQVTRVQVVDDAAGARAELARRVRSPMPMRTALPQFTRA